MTKIYKPLCFLLITLVLGVHLGCSTTGKSIAAEAGAGSVAGMGVGAIADPGSQGQNRFRNVVIGTALGAGVGAGAGFILGEHLKEERNEARDQGKKEGIKEAQSVSAASSGTAPRLIPARTEARWVPDQAHGNTFIPGHFEFQILEAARWESAQ